MENINTTAHQWYLYSPYLCCQGWKKMADEVDLCRIVSGVAHPQNSIYVMDITSDDEQKEQMMYLICCNTNTLLWPF